MKGNILAGISILLFLVAAWVTSEALQFRQEKRTPTVEVYASVELISGEQVPKLFFVPEDFYTLEIRPRRGEFWLVATTPRGDVRLMPGVIYVHKFTRQKKQGNG